MIDNKEVLRETKKQFELARELISNRLNEGPAKQALLHYIAGKIKESDHSALLRLKIVADEDKGTIILLAGVSPTATMEEVFASISALLNIGVDSLVLSNDRLSLHNISKQDYGDSIVESLGFSDMDAIRVTRAAPKSEGYRSRIMSQLEIHSVRPLTPLQTVFVAIHCTFFEYGFVCLSSAPSDSLPGFAAPLKELPPGKFLPDNWANGPALVLCYKHKNTPGKLFNFSVVEMGEDSCIAALSQKNGISQSIIVPFNEAFVSPSPYILNDDSIYKTTQYLYAPFVDLVTSESKSKIESASSGENDKADWSERETREVTPRLGREDLHPRLPSFASPLTNPIFGQGNLMGPRHPYFTDPSGYETTQPDHFLEPRFDPFFPVVGPNPSGFDIRPQGPGNKNRRSVPGEPDSDHLRPPTLNFDRFT